MKRLVLVPLFAAFALSACDSPAPTGIPSRLVSRPGGVPVYAIAGFSAIDVGAGPGDPRPNADAAAASFDAAASALNPLKYENFESAPLGNFSSLTLANMTVTMSGTASDVDAGITNVAGSGVLGYNTTGDGSRHLRFVPPFVEVPIEGPPLTAIVTVTFTPTEKLQAWGAYLTGVQPFPNTTVEVVFDDGTSQSFLVPGDLDLGGATFFGFTDPGKLITSVTVRETVVSGQYRDILSIDDVRFAPANSSTQFVPANEPATVAAQEDGKPVAGINIPAGTFAEDVTVTVRFDPVIPGDPCHAFLIGQIGRCLEVTARNGSGQKVINQEPLTIGLCLDADRPLEMYKFEEATGRATPLEQTSAGFLDCDGFQLAKAQPRNRAEALALAVMKRVGGWITPKSAWASDRGFGGIIPDGDGLSTFTWASPIQIVNARLAVNVKNKGKDLFTVRGTFDLATPKSFAPYLNESGFNPATDVVTVTYGKDSFTIPVNGFKYNRLLRRYLYAAIVPGTGISAMELNPDNGNFIVAGVGLTQGSGDPTTRAFTLQIGHRLRGGLLECGTLSVYKCQLEHQQ